MSKDLPIPPRFEKQDRPQLVALLKAVKSRLSIDGSDGLATFIAEAVADTLPSGAPYNSNVFELRAQMAKVLRRSHFWFWMERRVGVDFTRAEVQAARHRWVDQMIEDFGGTP